MLLAVVVLAIAVPLPVPSASRVDATSIVPFAPVFSTNDNGSIAVFGNNLMVCPSSDGRCAGARAGTNSQNNNSFGMVHLDVDGAAFPTYSSSSADVALPSDGEVRWAGLYWGGRLRAGRNGTAATGDGRRMKLRAPGDASYRTITADRLFGPTSTADRAYQGFADVTSLVQQAGPGTYFGADVPAATGEDRYAGWSLVVVYRSPSLPLRNLTVNDGLADVGRNDPQVITISGFRTPVSGPVNARIGLVAYEGDIGASGDRAIVRDSSNPNGTLLATALSPGTNFFNGANDRNGTLVTARAPADRNMFGFDIKNFDGPGILANDSTSAQIDLASTSERYFPGVVTTAIDLFAPDFSPSTKTVTNLSGGAPARSGDRLHYTVTFINDGQDPAIDTSIVDPIPAGTSFVPGSLVLPAGVSGSFDPAQNRVEVDPGEFPVGRSVRFEFDVDVGAAAANTTVVNHATITYDGATVPELQDLTFSTAAAAIAVVPSADLVVTKVNDPASVVAGNVLTSTIAIRNDGPNAAADVRVTDELPSALTDVGASSSAGSCSVVGTVTCDLGTVAAGAVVTVTVTARVPPNSTVASATDVARVSSPTSDPDPADNTAAAATDVNRDADLSVTKSATPTTVPPGGEVTYTIVATNDGPSTAVDVAITDSVADAGLELTAASAPGATCAFQPSTARCNVPTLAPGATVTMTVVARANPDATGGTRANVASVSSATPDSDPTDDESVAQVTIGPPQSILSVTKSATPTGTVQAGIGEVRYTIDVVNTGPSDAAVVAVDDTLPAGLVVLSVATNRGQCTTTPDASGDRVACQVGPLAAPFGGLPGARATITIVADVPADVAAGTYDNIASAQVPGSPPTNSNQVDVDVAAQADLSIVKSFPAGADPDITPGATEAYRVRVVNDGPAVARDVVVTDSLPAGLTAVAWTADPPVVCDVPSVSCTLDELAPGATVELELDVAVDAGLVIDPAVGVTNSATVAGTTTDPNPSNNTSSFTASGGAQADLSIRKLGPSPEREPHPVPAPIAGENTSYVIEVVNFGPSTAQNVTWTDALPPGMSFVRGFDPPDPTVTLDFCSGDGGAPETVTCDFPVDFPAFAGTYVGIEVSLDPTVADGTALSNTATVTSDADDGNLGNNTSTAVVAVRALSNLRTTKRVFEIDPVTLAIVREVPVAEVLSLPAGYPLQFRLDVVNDGPSAASDVSLVDTFDALAGIGLQGVDCEIRALELYCPYSNPATGDLLLPDDGTAATRFSVPLLVVPISDTPEGTYTNRFTAATATEETTLADNSDTRDVEIIEPLADLRIDKVALTSPLVAGETFTYQIEVNAGLLDFAATPPVLRWSSDAEDVVVTDTLPVGLVPTGVTTTQGDCTLAGQEISCELGTVAALVGPEPVAPALVTITGTVEAGIAIPDVTNTATATTSTAITGGVTQVADSVTTPITRSADLAVTKAAVADTAVAGGGATFTVSVTNTGPSDASAVVLTDLLPAPLVFDAAASDGSCAVVTTDVVCDLGTVDAGSSRSITISASLPPDAPPGTVVNTATASSDVPDPDDTDDSASAPVEVTYEADLSVTKTSAADSVLLGDTMTYTLAVTNSGPSDAADVVLTESIPAGTSAVTPLPAGCAGTVEITCDLGDVPAGDTRTVRVEIDVPDTTPLGPLDNIATVTSTTADPDPDDNASIATVEAVAHADITLTKTLLTENPIAGEPLQFLLTVTNNGPTVAPNAGLSDPVPTGTTFGSLEPTQGACRLDDTEGAPSSSCEFGLLAVGATASATLTVNTDPDLSSVSNTGFGGSGGFDDLPTDNEDTATGTLQSVADLSITKSGPATVSSGDPAEYTIRVANAGPSTATDVVVTDDLPPGLTPRPVAGCAKADSTLTCAIGDLVPGGTRTIAVTADVSPTLALGTELENSATVDSGIVDPDPGNNTAAVTSTVDALNDVGVTVTADQARRSVGERATYTVVVTNHGPHPADDVVLTNVLPSELMNPEVIAGEGGRVVEAERQATATTCTTSGPTATCRLGTVGVDQSHTFRFGGMVSSATPPGTRLVDSGSVRFDGVDAFEANDDDDDTILVIASPTSPPTSTPSPVPTTIRPSPPVPGLPATGAAIAGLLVVASLLLIAGVGLRMVLVPERSGRRR